MVLILCCLTSSASALTVSEFISGYNEAIGKGFYTVRADEFYIDGNYWFVSGMDSRHRISILFDKGTAESPLDYTVKSVFVQHKPRVSVGVFVNNISAALASAYPDIPEQERLYEAMMCLGALDRVFADYYSTGDAYPWNTEHMGQFVYQEDTEYRTFMFSLTDDTPSSAPDRPTEDANPAPTPTPQVYDLTNAITLPIGDYYIVGVDLPAGNYAVLADPSVEDIGFFGFDVNGGFLYGHAVGNYVALDATLPEGASVKITKGPAVLIPQTDDN